MIASVDGRDAIVDRPMVTGCGVRYAIDLSAKDVAGMRRIKVVIVALFAT